jgi:hypothetical protein
MLENKPNNSSSLFPVEIIPDNQLLFYRINAVNIDTDFTIGTERRIKTGAFDPQPKPHGKEMSVNWEKYSTAADCQASARKPEKNGVVSFNSTDIRQIIVNIIPLQYLDVRHAPTTNQAHAVIFEVIPESNDPELRIKLRRICKWEITI